MLVFLVSCTTYYTTANLNNLSPGQTKAALLQRFPTRDGLTSTYGLVIRAAKTQPDGSLIEVGTLQMARDGVNNPVEYWLLFRDGTLVQWGQPDDWQAVSARYQIDFNPGPAVRP